MYEMGFCVECYNSQSTSLAKNKTKCPKKRAALYCKCKKDDAQVHLTGAPQGETHSQVGVTIDP